MLRTAYPMLVLTLLVLSQGASPLGVVDDLLRTEVNVLHYEIEVVLPDSGALIQGATTIHYLVRTDRGALRLDFDTALVVDSVSTSGTHAVALEPETDWAVSDDGAVTINHWGARGDTVGVTLHYHGRPRDGLYIRNNVHGDRTAFADNWPNRAHHWFPAVDHPSDKATVTFSVEVPAGWRAVANGRLVGVDTLTQGRTRWRWRESHEIPVYTMVLGAGPLAVTEIGTATGVPHSVWTFSQDSAFAVEVPFARANLVLETFTRVLGPFPYEKLAHVESSTRFGGMENSSAIFYAERGYASRRMGEGVVVHETAHQWFGDAVTERDWHHLWLSEGFATYLAALFYELIGEDSTFRARMESAKRSYMGSDVVDRPVIDTTEKDLFQLLNANNYPKGSWVLHMLRGEIGDSAFFGGLREYYSTYRDSTALTSDLLSVMERQAGRPLDWFFEQWLLQPGYPKLEAEWSYDAAHTTLELSLAQVQAPAWGVYRLSVPIRIEFGNGPSMSTTALIDARRSTVNTGGVPSEPVRVRIDAEGDLLIEVVRLAEVRR